MLEKYATKPTYDENGRILAFKLAPCPFCGGNELKILDDSGVIFCRTCSTTGPLSEHPGHAWNEWYYRINGTSEKRKSVFHRGLREDIARIADIVECNAKVINEIYDSLMKCRKGVAVLHNELIRDEMLDLDEVARLHAEWDGKSPHPYGCDGGDGPNEDLDLERPDEVKKPNGRRNGSGPYVEPIRIAGKLEIQVGMLDGCHNGEFCLHTVAENMEEGRMIPFWTTRLETEELQELRNAISEALLIASKF